jgi:hypothetical protein
MPKGTKVYEVEKSLEKQYGKGNKRVYATLNQLGFMHGNKPTAEGLQKSHKKKK